MGEANGRHKMTSFDRLAWRCSSIAPVAFLAAIGALLLYWAGGGVGTEPSAAQPYLPVVAFLLIFLGLAAHMVVHYHAVKSGTFPPGTDRARLEVSVRWGFLYARWRTLMRAQHPELRSRQQERD